MHKGRTALLALLLVGGGCAGQPSSPAPPSATLTPAATVPVTEISAVPTSTPGVATPSPAPVSGPAFACADASGGGASRANVVAVRAAAGPGYDRFVLEFDGPVPGYSAVRQTSATFTQDASGRLVTLDGSSGVLVRLEPAASKPSAPLAASPRSTVLRDVRQVGDFEGVVHWGLGLAAPACMRAFTLDGPARLVIDFKS